MSHIEISYTLDDTTAGNFTYDSNKIEFTPSGAQLKLVDFTAQTFNQPFTADPGFTYDSALTEFVAGKCQQKDQQPNADSAADYSSSIDLSWGGGTLTGTATGGAAVSGGELDLSFSDIRYVDYSATGNADSTQVGAVKMKFRPNYSGTPVAGEVPIHMGESGNQNNQIAIAHVTGTGKLRIVFYDTVGTLIATRDLGVFNPTAGVQYEIELDWDLTTGSSRLFLDGIQSGTTETATGTRNAASIMRVGSNFSGVNSSNFKVDDLIFYPTVQHTTNYTPGYDVWKYKEDLITLPSFSYSGLGAIQSYDGFSSTQVGGIRFNVNGMYYTGSVWAASDDSYAQMNDPSTINVNISSLTAADTVDLKMRTVTNHSQEYADDLDVTYTGEHYPTDNPTIEINAGVSADDIHVWDETDVTTPAGTTLKYVLPRAPALWWSGAAWVSSDETYAESNTQTEISPNLATLDISAGNTVQFLAFLNSDGTDTPIVHILRMEYDFFSIIGLPDHTTVFGQIIDMGQNVLPGSTITVQSVTPFMHGNNSVMIDTSTTSDGNGVFELDVIETESVGQFVSVTIEHVVGPVTTTVVYDNIIIPNVITVSLETLLTGKDPNSLAYYKAGTVSQNVVDPTYIRGIFQPVPLP
ncbi:MAG: hypothetical protein V3V84_00710 [Candidatus Bathyarchaeia archaeon]